MQGEIELIEVAVRAAFAGSQEILEVYETAFDVSLKSDQSPLTEADQRAHVKIMEGLAETGLPILSEEGRDIPFSERKDWGTFWMVDPLDGTKEFVKRNGEFTVNIALIQNGTPIMGVILVPVSGDLYVGSKGVKAFKISSFKNPEANFPDWEQQSVSLPVSKNYEGYRVVGSRSHPSEETEQFLNTLREQKGDLEFVSMGSSLKICLVAEGAADIYPRFAPTMEWDTAAGHGIALASGKEIMDYTTKQPMRYNKENLLNNWFVVS